MNRHRNGIPGRLRTWKLKIKYLSCYGRVHTSQMLMSPHTGGDAELSYVAFTLILIQFAYFSFFHTSKYCNSRIYSSANITHHLAVAGQTFLSTSWRCSRQRVAIYISPLAFCVVSERNGSDMSFRVNEYMRRQNHCATNHRGEE